MALDTPSPRARGLRRMDLLPSNTRLNKSPTRSQRKEDRIPRKHHNIFDQTLLPEEDFSGGKLLRRRKTTGPYEHLPPKENIESPLSLTAPISDTNSFDEIQVSRRPRGRPSIAALPSSPLSSSQTLQREFRVRDKKVDYTIPSLKSLLPTPPRKRRSSAPPLSVPKVHSQAIVPSTLPRETDRPRPRTVTNRMGERSLLMKLRISPNKLTAITNKVANPKIRIVESTSRKRRLMDEEGPTERKAEEKPFGGILSNDDADTFRQTPTEIDRARFERAKEKSMTAQSSITVARSASEVPSSVGPVTETAFRIRSINFGNYRVKTHYASPYPEEYSRQSVLSICEFCLKYMTGDWVGWRHRLKCPVKHPPGDEIYRDGKISIFEVDGRKNPVYCQNLCLLAKMYLDHKTLYYDVEPFLFYVLCECDDRGCHFVGYFSKEKRSMAGYNLSCIVTLPIYQRKGYGFFLISFSYLLSQRENRLGSPEKPLSDLGLLSYRSYWKTAIANAILEVLNRGTNVSIQELSRRTGMTDDDVISGLEGLDALVRDPETGIYAIKVNRERLVERVDLVERKGYVKVNEQLLKWTPYLLGRKEAKEMLEGGLVSLTQQRRESGNSQLDEVMVSTDVGDVIGTSIPPERFVSVAVKDLFQPQVAYHTTGSQTPGPIPTTPGANSVSASVVQEDGLMNDMEDEAVNSSPSSPSVVDEEISDEPYSADEIDEDPSDEEMSDYISDDSNDFNPRKRKRLTRPSQNSPNRTQEVVVRVKQVAKAPRSRAFVGSQESEARKVPRVIAAKAPRSRAGRNPPEVMARRTSSRRG